MLFRLTTKKSVEDVAFALQKAVEESDFGLMHTHNLKESMQKKGVSFPNPCYIFEICQPHQAKEVLQKNMDISTALPCRIVLYQEGDETSLATIKPTFLLEMFHEPQLKEIALDIEQKMIAIMKKAIE